jgi:hypothetical protein
MFMSYFYKTGVDITKDKSMFNFIAEHPTYYTMNSWNRTRSIAHNVKLYNLELDGEWSVALAHLASGQYDTIHFMIDDWECEHPGYCVYFNGRSGGYLVLGCANSHQSALPTIFDYETYEDYKVDMRDWYGSVKAGRQDLVDFVRLVQDFDKLCDNIRDFVNELSKLKYEVEEMCKIVEQFNDEYADDLELLGFDYLMVSDAGEVDIAEICTLQCLAEAFKKIADRKDVGYQLVPAGDMKVKLEKI